MREQLHFHFLNHVDKILIGIVGELSFMIERTCVCIAVPKYPMALGNYSFINYRLKMTSFGQNVAYGTDL